MRETNVYNQIQYYKYDKVDLKLFIILSTKVKLIIYNAKNICSLFTCI